MYIFSEKMIQVGLFDGFFFVARSIAWYQYLTVQCGDFYRLGGGEVIFCQVSNE